MLSNHQPEHTSDVLLIQLGVGQVGSAVASSALRLADNWQRRFGPRIRYHALADSSGFVAPPTLEALTSALEARTSGQPLVSLPGGLPMDNWRDVLEAALLATGQPERVIVVDCAVGHGMSKMLLAARAAGAHVVLCNKDPLTGPYRQFQRLQGDIQRGSLHLSATVGAGLPITSVLAAAMASGDTVLELHTVASGSLGHLCGALSAGASFPEALQSAIDAGYCEPDPRVDLSGHDVARKLLILARLAGHTVELADVQVESLVPSGAESLPRDAFLAALPSWRDHLREPFAAARASGHVLRYVGSMDATGSPRASLCEVGADDLLARGQGPENIFTLRTERYQCYPLVIAGPGAGVAVTAGAVISDLLRAANIL